MKKILLLSRSKTVVEAPSYLLDDYSDCSMAWSFRSLKSVEIDTVRVRRSNDNAELDFTPTEITDGTLVSWTGANDGYVVSKYDWTGNVKTLTTATTTAQPKIVTAGVLNVDAGKPYMQYTGDEVSTTLNITSTGLSSTTGTIFMVYNSSDLGSGCLLGSAGNSGYLGVMADGSATSPDGSAGAPNYYKNGSTTPIARTRDALYDAFVTGEDVLITITNIDLSNAYWETLIPYVYRVNSLTAQNKAKEMLVWNSDQTANRAGIEANINAHYSIFEDLSTLKPKLLNFSVENATPTRVYFESTSSVSGMTTTGFTISGKTISSVTINGTSTTGHYFTVSSAFTFWDNNTIRLESGDGTVYDFTLTYIENNIVEPPSTGNVYYVDKATGNNADTGLTEALAWETLTYALRDGSPVTDGDIVYVKAGNYGNENILSYIGSTSPTNPIKVIGYKTTPGDITSLYYSTLGDALDSSEMPLFDGGDVTVGQAFWHKESRDNIIYRNLQFQNYRKGFQTRYSHDNMLFERIIVMNIGNETTGTDGRGFDGKSNGFNANTNLRYKDIISMNAQEECFSAEGSNILVDNVKVYNDRSLGDESTLSTDYYLIITGSNNIVRNCFVDKHTSDGFGGHGIQVKADTYTSEYNLFENNEVVNMAGSLTARHVESKYNVFKNNEVHANVAYRSTVSYLPSAGGATNGATDNIWENNYFHDLEFGSGNSAGTEGGAGEGGQRNIFRNNIYSNIDDSVFSFSNENTGVIKATNSNKFYNNTIYNAINLFSFSTLTGGLSYLSNEFKNNIINTVTNKVKTGTGYEDATGTGWDIDYNNFYNGFTAIGTNQNTDNPTFDAVLDDTGFTPINAALVAGTTLIGLEYDYDNTERDSTTPTIGAKEI